MNKANYLSEGRVNYPLTCDTLNFIQEQILFLQQLTTAFGSNVVLKQSTVSATPDGLIVIDGELLPLQGRPNKNYIAINNSTPDITINSTTYSAAQTIRYAYYTANAQTNGVDNIQRTAVPVLDTGLYSLLKLTNELKEAKQNLVPKGTIIAWKGSISVTNVPYGWIPCCGYVAGVYINNQTEGTKWEAKYPDHTLQYIYETQAIDSEPYIRITQFDNIVIPDLGGKVIVGSGYKVDNNTYEAVDFSSRPYIQTSQYYGPLTPDITMFTYLIKVI